MKKLNEVELEIVAGGHISIVSPGEGTTIEDKETEPRHQGAFHKRRDQLFLSIQTECKTHDGCAVGRENEGILKKRVHFTPDQNGLIFFIVPSFSFLTAYPS